MTKEEFIEGVRNYLDEPPTKHLLSEANKTDDVEVHRKLLVRAKSMHQSYIDDANYWLLFK